MSNDKGTWFGWDVSQRLVLSKIKICTTWLRSFAVSVGKGEVEAKPENQEVKQSFNRFIIS